MFYAIEKQGAEWIIYAQGVAILRCEQADIALEVAQMAQERMQAHAQLKQDYGKPRPVFLSGDSGAALSMRR